MKNRVIREEKRKWKNFMRGMLSEEEKANLVDGKNHILNGQGEDRISEFIRNEAIKTWTVGKELGIVGKKNEEELIARLEESERLDEARRAQVMEKK